MPAGDPGVTLLTFRPRGFADMPPGETPRKPYSTSPPVFNTSMMPR